ncbi:MAG: M28 family peptidase [Candidatus Neomarinimicrobiota bacterium]|jgi:hypothetical protein|nr:M28 family peptidase [Candidatus Neomarinimicrobiota bacterium]MDD3965793.1 M28 family peptidase [Candidatus Neomarinimicrobiota bacterium]MDX9779842.1 M28 family peptidase [bacterium]
MKKIIAGLFFLVQLLGAETAFDGFRAFAYLEEQVKIGPRIPGTETHRICRDRIIRACRQYADTVIVQDFFAYRPVTRDTVAAWNIIARFYPENPQRVMFSAHWDTRPFADLDPLYPDQPVPGANDGASGTAVLMEMLPHITDFADGLGVDLVFWDAEDLGIAGTNTYFCQGSEYYSRNLLPPVAQKGILIDMIGDAELEIPVELNSSRFAPDLIAEIWALAVEHGHGRVFQRRPGYEIYDDHVPLNRTAKIPTINLIDFNYTRAGRNLWHTTRDLPAYCSPHSLKTVGDILLLWLKKQ